MNLRPLSRPRAATNIARSSRALLAFAVTAGVTFQGTTFASAQDDASVESYLADLVNQATDTKNQVTTMEGEMGGLRESANKARVDLTESQKKAQEAQNQVLDARGRLKQSDKDVQEAQKRLDEIARSAYAQGGDATPVHLAAGGGDAAADTLDRASYIRMASEKQQNEVQRLDLARTQTANEESTLRDSRNSADQAVSAALDAYKAASDALASSQQKLKDIQAAYKKLVAERDAAQKRLEAARKAVDAFSNTHPQASSWDKRRVAETAADGAAKAADSQTDKPENSAATMESAAPAESAKPAESTGSTDSTESTESNDAAESAPANSTDKQNSTAEGKTEDKTPVSEDPATLPEMQDVSTDFEGSAAGDNQRQQALDGLAAAGRDAAMAGFATVNAGGSAQSAINAAANAGRQTAGNAYDAAMGVNNAGTGGTDGITGTEGGAEDTNAPQREDNAPVDAVADPIQDAVNQAQSNQDLPPSDASVDSSGTAAQQIERVIERARSQLGVTYAWGGGNYYGPTKGIRDGGVADSYGDYAKVGFDCSGLMMYAFYAAGIELQHYSGYQYTSGRQVPVSEAKRGDMLFWGPGGSNHVALYLGDGQMIEAPQSGSTVQISPVRWGGIAPYAVRMIE